MKKLSNVFGMLAILLSNIMCAVVAYRYCDMLWGIKFGGYSAPAGVAFIYAIPYLIGIAVCVVIALTLRVKGK